MTKLPALDVPNMINFLVGMLNTPSPTGFTEKAIDYTEEAFSAFPFLELRPTRKGALVATWTRLAV